MKNEKEAIYTITLDNFIEKEVRKKSKGEDGKEIEVVEVVKENRATEFYFKKPSRRECDTMEEEFSIEMSKSIKKGIMTKAMLAKEYRENGGVLTKAEEKGHADMYMELAKAEDELAQLISESKNKRKQNTLVKKIKAFKEQILNIERPHQEMFNNTADVRAQTAATKWILLNCCFRRAYKSADFNPIFKGEDYEDKLDNYYKLYDEEGDAEENNIIFDLMGAVSIWYFTRTDDIQAYVDSITAEEAEEADAAG